MGPSDISDATASSPLGRTSPIVKLGVALGWLIGLAFTTDPRPPIAIAFVAIASGVILGRVGIARLVRAILPLGLAAIGIGAFNVLFSASNVDPAATELARLGPLRITPGAVAGGVGLGLRVLAIASVGAVFSLTTDSTRLVDALVQQARVSERFAYGALAAYQAVPRFGEDLATLRQARRVRGLRGSWHPRILVGLLILAIRHGDRLALAMDARAFGSGPRSRYRTVAWGPWDALVAIGAMIALVVALRLRAG
jgi:energy-coupling factor transport system permease protein